MQSWDEQIETVLITWVAACGDCGKVLPKEAISQLAPFYHDAATICLRHETDVRHVRGLTGLTPVLELWFARVALLDDFFEVVRPDRWLGRRCGGGSCRLRSWLSRLVLLALRRWRQAWN